MADVLHVPAGLTRLLRRTAVERYAAEIHDAHACAVGLLSEGVEPNAAALCQGRVAVLDADRAISLVGDDVSSDEDWAIPLDGPNRDCIVGLIDATIQERDPRDAWRPDPDEPIAGACLSERLRALRAELTSGGDDRLGPHRFVAGDARRYSGRLAGLLAIDHHDSAIEERVAPATRYAAGGAGHAVEPPSDDRQTQTQLTSVLRAALDAREHHSSTHSDAAVSLAHAVARRLDLRPEDIRTVEQVALLHGIGKIGLPDHILEKRGPLNPAEWQAMCRHPAIGARIVASISSLAHLAPAIRAAHECWDGTGYPDGLSGDQIPVASRIVLACDALYAMTSDRPYRKAMPMAGALRGLRRQAGTKFDPAVIAALLDEVACSTVPAPAPGDAKPSVLVVEDQAQIRLGLEHGLTSEGFRVHVAANATEAYDAVADTCFELIVLNWLLSGADSGATACRRLRYLHPSGEIVVLSALSDVRDQRAALEAGATAYLQKSIPLPALAERLRDVALAA